VLMLDYFAEIPTYLPVLFRIRYKMRRELFVKIVQPCEANSHYFTRRRNATGIIGFSSWQKISAAMRMIAYGIPAKLRDVDDARRYHCSSSKRCEDAAWWCSCSFFALRVLWVQSRSSIKSTIEKSLCPL
jgi:hypothetical protein